MRTASVFIAFLLLAFLVPAGHAAGITAQLSSEESYHVYQVDAFYDSTLQVAMQSPSGNLDLAVMDLVFPEAIEYALFSSVPVISNPHILAQSANTSDEVSLEQVSLTVDIDLVYYIIVYSSDNYYGLGDATLEYELHANADISRLATLPSGDEILESTASYFVAENGDNQWDQREYYFLPISIAPGETLDVYLTQSGNSTVYAMLYETNVQTPESITNALSEYADYITSPDSVPERLQAIAQLDANDKSVYLTYKNNRAEAITTQLIIFSWSAVISSTEVQVYHNNVRPLSSTIAELAVFALLLLMVIAGVYYFYRNRSKSETKPYYSYPTQEITQQPQMYAKPIQVPEQQPRPRNFCEFCGYNLSSSAAFCGNCGERVK